MGTRSRLAAALCALAVPGFATGATGATGAAGAGATGAAAEACQDFDAYVNADWLARAELPPERARIGSFDELRVGSDRLLGQALAELVADAARQNTPGLKLLATLCASAIDDASIDQRGIAALRPWLARIDQLDRAALPASGAANNGLKR